jgi:hypothetical protein
VLERRNAAQSAAPTRRKVFEICTDNLVAGVLKQGKSKEAAAVFRGMTLRSDHITPRKKAVVICVLAANSRPDQAELVGAMLDAALLTTEEVEMVENYLDR